MSTATETYPIISDDPAVQAVYEHCREEGESHNMSKICALRQPPGSCTNRELFAGVGTLADQFDGDEKTLDYLCKVSESEGRRPNPNDFYQPGLADHPGDPKAFIQREDGMGQIKKIAQQSGSGCRGLVNVAPGPSRLEPLPGPPLAPDIIKRGVDEMIRENPELRFTRDRKDLAAEYCEKHAPPK